MSSSGQGAGGREPWVLGRREFLGRAGGIAAAVGLRGVPRLARGKLGAIGIQLYTVRRELAKDVEGTLSKLAAIGFKEAEFAGDPEGRAKSLRAILDRLHLIAPSGHAGCASATTTTTSSSPRGTGRFPATCGPRRPIPSWCSWSSTCPGSPRGAVT